MSDPGPWQAVAKECPRRAPCLLHESGYYVHGYSPEAPGRLICATFGVVDRLVRDRLFYVSTSQRVAMLATPSNVGRDGSDAAPPDPQRASVSQR